MELSSVVLLLGIPCSFYLALLFLASHELVNVINSGGRLSATSILSLMLMLVSAYTPLLLFLPVLTLSYLLASFLALLVLIFISSSLKQRLVVRKCEAGVLKEEELRGNRYRVSSQCPLAAFAKRGRVYIDEKLLSRLTEEELLAVLHHEVEHTERRPLELLATLSLALWASLAPLAVLLLYLVKLEVVLFASLYVLAMSATLVTVALSWMSELAADLRGARKVSAENMAKALVKVYLVSLESRLGCVRIEGGVALTDMSRPIRVRDVMVALAKSSILPFTPIHLAMNPLPETHPPLDLRLKALLRSLRSRRG